ncbi:MAG: hypothetical protein AAF411_27685, partial [Myxococcota bacterium]
MDGRSTARKSKRLGAVLGAVALIGACSTTAATARIRVPAQIPLRTFPYVVVIPESTPDSQVIARGLLDRLQGSPSEAILLSETALASRRAQRTMPAASVVVRIFTRFDSSFVSRPSRNNETVCGPNGCFTRPRTVFVQVPLVHGELFIEVHDGPTDARLQRMRFTADEQGGGVDVLLRDRVVARLGGQLLEALEPRTAVVRVEFERVRLEGMESALDLLEAGRWSRGRERLEALRPKAEMLPARARAAYFYNLGLALRFEGQGQREWSGL